MTLEPWIEHDKRRGTFVVRWRDASGKKCRDEISYPSKADVKERKNIIRKRLVDQSLGKGTSNESIAGCVEEFLEAKKDERMAPKRLEVYHYAFALFYKLPGLSSMTDIKKQTILDYRAALYKTGYAIDTIITYLSMLRAFLNWGVENGKIHANPINEIKRAIPKREPHPRFYSDEEIRAFEGAIQDAEFRAICRLGYMAGLRDSEILRIERPDIAWYPADNAGELKIYADESKTGEPRLVPLSSSVYQVLPKPSEGPLFPGWNYVKLLYHFRKAKALAGVKDKTTGNGVTIFATFYGFRHTFARVFLESGGNIRELQMILGHKSLRMMEVYAHFGNTHLRKRIGEMRDLSAPQCGAPAGQLGQIYETNGSRVLSSATVNKLGTILGVDGKMEIL